VHALLAVAASAIALSGALPVLDTAALPGLDATTHAVGARDLAADLAGGASFEARLRGWGFQRGRERDFQGPSKHIDRAVSRTLVFATAAGARGYVTYIGTHAAALYGPGSTSSALVSRGRTGVVIDAAACACHRATPTLLAVVARGTRVTWLEANGGEVTRPVLAALLARAP
jgi:hypothetical protein